VDPTRSSSDRCPAAGLACCFPGGREQRLAEVSVPVLGQSIEYNEHGQTYWIPYYLQQMQQFEQQHGYRLLDVLDVHAYIAPSGLSGSVGNAAMERCA